MIKPPRPIPALSDWLNEIKELAKQNILLTVQDHLEISMLDTDEILKTLNPKNGDQAAYVAERQLTRFGKKMTRNFIKSTLLQGLDILGTKTHTPAVKLAKQVSLEKEFPAMESTGFEPSLMSHTPKRQIEEEDEDIEDNSPLPPLLTPTPSTIKAANNHKKIFRSNNTLGKLEDQELDKTVAYIYRIIIVRLHMQLYSSLHHPQGQQQPVLNHILSLS